MLKRRKELSEGIGMFYNLKVIYKLANHRTHVLLPHLTELVSVLNYPLC